MLETQKYLLGGKSLDDLAAELGIRVNKHDALPLVILNYDQIDSPKTHPIVRECRALVLRTDTFDVVARSFPRFFNWGEVQDEMASFDFSDFSVQSKEDGSLVLIYHFDGDWRINTRGSFANENLPFQNFTWGEGICRSLGVKDVSELGLACQDVTLVGEFCSPWNKVVRTYPAPVFYLLTAFNTKTGQELTLEECDRLTPAGVLRPTLYKFKSIEEIQAYLNDQAANDPTFEGVVIRDRHNHRWKIKSATYLGLHRLKGDGDNLFNPKNLLPFVLSGEQDELLTYFPEVRPHFFELKCKVLERYIDLLEAWSDHRHIEGQKDFALAVKDRPLSGLLFQARKEGKPLRALWREAGDSILKHLKCNEGL